MMGHCLARQAACRRLRLTGGACAYSAPASSPFVTRERGDLGSRRPKGVSGCPIESRKRGAAKSGCHAGFGACSGDLSQTRRKPFTRNGKLNLGGRLPRTRIERRWVCCQSCTARVGRSAASSSSVNRAPSSPARLPRRANVPTEALVLCGTCGSVAKPTATTPAFLEAVISGTRGARVLRRGERERELAVVPARGWVGGIAHEQRDAPVFRRPPASGKAR